MEGEVLYRCGKQVVRGRKSGRNAARVCEISKWGLEGAGGGGAPRSDRLWAATKKTN